MNINVIMIENMSARIEIEHNNQKVLIPSVDFIEEKGEFWITYEAIVSIAEAIDMKWKISNTGAQMSVAMEVLQAIRERLDATNDTRGEG